MSRYAEAMWLDALEEVEKYVEMNLHARGRGKRANAVEEHGNSLIGNGERMVLPFDGGVALRIDEWLEANMHGDKAESTSRAYQSSWQKWVAWARRQAWDSEYLDPKQSKLENENKLLAFLGYMGWLGVITSNNEADSGINQRLPQESRGRRPHRRNVPDLAAGQLPG